MTPNTKPLSLIDLIESFPTPEAARLHLEATMWADGVVCPHCGVVNEATKLGGKAGAKGQWKCRACRQKFTVTTGTIYESSHIQLHKWLIAVHLMCANKKGVSALSLSRMLHMKYQSAWFMCHRIRYAMEDLTTSTEPLTGTIEVDETYVGGKEKNKHKSKRLAQGRGTVGKTPVVALVERNGNVRARVVTSVDEKTIGPILKEHIAEGSLMMTDDAIVYTWHQRHNPEHVEHRSVNHTRGEYVRKEADGKHAGTQTVESFNALVKRSIVGAWHNVSEEHLPKYINEVGFRWNTRKVTDGERAEQAHLQAAGRRLMYREAIKSP